MDFLNDFDYSDDEEQSSNQQKTQNYPPFTPNLQEKFWFRKSCEDHQIPTTINEVDLFRIADFFDLGSFERSEKLLNDIRKNTKNNRTHEIMLIDSLFQCTIARKSNLIIDLLNGIRLLPEYESLLVDFGDQIQFLRTKAFFYTKCPDTKEYGNEFKKTMALLLQLCGSFENWQIFELGSMFLTASEIYGVKMKIKKVLYYEIEHSKGFVKEKLKRELKKIEEKEEELKENLDQEEIDSILASLNSHKDTSAPDSESATSSEFRAHESRSKNTLIPKDEQAAVIADFFKRFPFLSAS